MAVDPGGTTVSAGVLTVTGDVLVVTVLMVEGSVVVTTVFAVVLLTAAVAVEAVVTFISTTLAHWVASSLWVADTSSEDVISWELQSLL